MRKIALTLLAGGLLAATVAAPAFARPAAPAPTIASVVVNSPDHTILESLVIDLGLAETLSSRGQYTVFAPTDAAFAPVLPVVAGCSADQLRDIVLYHVTRGARDSGDVVGSSKIRMLNGDFAAVSVTTDPLNVSVGGADLNLGALDIRTSNGIVHVTDEVLVPADFAGC